jgi:DNA (cytosine-5)-methyltransferase 1
VAKQRLLDLFCGAGGAAMGYHRAGFEVVGVDINPQPEYPFEFHCADALSYPMEGFDAVHASPPCKAHTVARRVNQSRFPALFDPHVDLVAPTRERLQKSGLPYVIENVVGAPLVGPVMLCGSMFGNAHLRRHRLFECSFHVEQPVCRHKEQGEILGVYGNGGAWKRKAPGGGGRKVVGADAAGVLGIDWTTYQPSLSQAIPPAYTAFIGEQLRALL